ncbi:hypothetical protein MKW92_046325 [Papaver armeniacum]|nr:hypothetical protein MKW92_046325 [Papaver armeniacum]
MLLGVGKMKHAATASVAAECIINRMKKKNNSTFINMCFSFCSGSDSDSSTFHQASSPNIVALEYADLQITNTSVSDELVMSESVKGMSTSHCYYPLPLMVDIGCGLQGSGRFLLWLAKKSPQTNNYLGLEIRQKLWVKELSLNTSCLQMQRFASEQIVSTYPGPLTFVSILFLQKILVDSIIKNLRPGGKIFIQSDVHEGSDMRNQFDAQSDELQHVDYDDAVDQQEKMCDGRGGSLRNPMGIRTEREIHAECEGAKIYRRMYQKK